ncbi:MAG: hypothetical protein QNK05_09915, partial [Myxococcota bacterium]|nr:hypothetical protein [Myxococcota bacterium]
TRRTELRARRGGHRSLLGHERLDAAGQGGGAGGHGLLLVRPEEASEPGHRRVGLVDEQQAMAARATALTGRIESLMTEE